jgi:hypothetical protein
MNNAYVGSGVPLRFFQSTVTVGASDSTGSTYTILKDLPADAIILEMEIETTGITGATSCDIGLYDSDSGAALVDNCYASGIDLSGSHTKVAPADGLAALSGSNTLQPAYLLAGKTLKNKKGNYDLVLTGDTLGGAGSATFRGLIGQAG